MIYILAPGPNLTFASTPSGTVYTSDYNNIIYIPTDSVADQLALMAAGCLTLSPLDGGAVKMISGNAYTVTQDDDRDYLLFTYAGNVSVTVPNNLPVGFETFMRKVGTGLLSVIAGSGASLVSASGMAAVISQYAALTAQVITNANGASAVYAIDNSGFSATGAWVGAVTLAGLYALDVTNHYATGTIGVVFNDAGTPANNGTWLKTGAGNGTGNWTQESTYTFASLAAAIAAETARATAQENAYAPTTYSYSFGGDLLDAGAHAVWILGGRTPPIAATATTFFTQLGLGYVAQINDSISYLDATPSNWNNNAPTRTPLVRYKAGDWVIASVLIESTDFSWFVPTGDTTGSVRVWAVGTDSTQVAFPMSTYEQVDTHIRRYYVIYQIPNTVTSDINECFFGCTGPSDGANFTSFTLAVTSTQPGRIDWANPDPFNIAATGRAIAALRATVDPQNTDDGLLLPSSFNLIQGRPLELYQGITKYRELSSYAISAVGSAAGTTIGARPAVTFADPVLRLDGNRFSGAGVIAAKRLRQDTINIVNRPTTFFSSAPTKTGSPNILIIGDSLTYRGTASMLKAKLVAAGATPNFIGTYVDSGGTWPTPTGAGTPCEGRPSWWALNYSFRRTATNQDFSGPIYPIRVGAGTPPTFTYTLSGGGIATITAVGGSGLSDCAALPVQIADAAGFGAYATMAISGGVPGAVTVVRAGSGYTAPLFTLPPTVAQYLALSNAPTDYGPRWQYNPFIRPAVGGDNPAYVFNGYIFDLGFYITRFSLPAPDIIMVALGTNDCLSNFDPLYDNQTADAVARIVSLCHSSYARPVGVIGNGLADTYGWGRMVPIIDYYIELFAGQESVNDTHLLPGWACQDDKFIYGITVGSTSSLGVQTGVCGDLTHPGQVGREQWAEMQFGFCMNHNHGTLT